MATISGYRCKSGFLQKLEIQELGAGVEPERKQYIYGFRDWRNDIGCLSENSRKIVETNFSFPQPSPHYRRKIAKDGVSFIMDFFARYQEPRLNSFIMFTKGEASELLKNKSLLEKVPSEETREIIKQGIGLKVR